MTESKIILTCIECITPDIVKTKNSGEIDSYHCHNCSQEYFESINYSKPEDCFENILLKKQNTILKDALKFYANPYNYTPDLDAMYGKNLNEKAFKALEEVKGVK